MFVSCEPEEKTLPYVAEWLGADNILFPSDYPHWDGAFPEAVNELMERQDVSESHAVLSHMKAPERGRVLNGEYMDHVDLAAGMRLHFLIFAALAAVPFLPLPYAGKVFDFAQSAGAPPLTGVAQDHVGLLLAEVDRLWEQVKPLYLSLHAYVRAKLREKYGDNLFANYGFVDDFNPTLVTGTAKYGRIVPGVGWFDTDYLGIDQGPIIAMIENYRSDLIWKTMRKNPYIVAGLKKAGFTGGWLGN